MPISTGLNHVAALTTDMDRTVGFYEAVFDAVVTHEVAPSDGHPWMKAVEVGGGAALHVFEVPADTIVGDRRAIGRRGAIDHFALAVASPEALESVRGRLVDAGAQKVGPVQHLGDTLSVFFRDPDGMELEVCCAAPVEAAAAATPQVSRHT